MGKKGIIAPIKKDYSNSKNLFMSTLTEHGFTRFPGTGITVVPFKEKSGKYRTGMDPKASWINNLPAEEAKIERERAEREFNELTEELGGLDLSPTSKFWNWTAMDDKGRPLDVKVMPVTLKDDENVFEFADPMRRIAFNFIRVHPMIARSIQAVQKGETQPGVSIGSLSAFYVKDNEVEQELEYNKRKIFNKAKTELGKLSPTKMRQIARLMGINIGDDTKEELVYNLIDTKISKIEGVKQFLEYVEVNNNLLKVKDLVKQALTNNVIRLNRGGKVFEGELELATSEFEYVTYLSDDENQQSLLELERKVNSKKSIFV